MPRSRFLPGDELNRQLGSVLQYPTFQYLHWSGCWSSAAYEHLSPMWWGLQLKAKSVLCIFSKGVFDTLIILYLISWSWLIKFLDDICSLCGYDPLIIDPVTIQLMTKSLLLPERKLGDWCDAFRWLGALAWYGGCGISLNSISFISKSAS